MPQLYTQTASRPDPWLVGRTSAGLCTLQTACPLTVTYSGGSPAADTIAAGSAATVYGGSAATFDASADVWVVLTVAGSGTLQVTKEADLAAVSGDWAGLARVAQHAVEPYQPQAYLAAGAPGSAPTSTLVGAVSDTAARALSLWNGSSNDAPPANWQSAGYDDSAWAPAVIGHDETLGLRGVPGSHILWSSSPGAAPGQGALFRHTFTLPAGLITAASLQIGFDATDLGLFINGTSLGTPQNGPGSWAYPASPDVPSVAVSVPPPALVAGGANVLAAWVANEMGSDPDGGLTYVLSVTYAGGGAVPAPAASAEGDLLYYQGGAWTDLPLGTSGQELSVVSGALAWATPSSGVTSVALSGPTGTTVGGSPVTSSGTLSLAWASQSARTFLGAPSGGSGAPTFRALVGADIPVDASTIISSGGVIAGHYQAGAGVSISGNTISATGSGGSVTSVALSVPGIFALAGSPITTSGTFAVTLATQTAATVFAGPASGSAAAPTFRALQGADLPAAAAAGGHIHAHSHFL